MRARDAELGDLSEVPRERLEEAVRGVYRDAGYHMRWGAGWSQIAFAHARAVRLRVRAVVAGATREEAGITIYPDSYDPLDDEVADAPRAGWVRRTAARLFRLASPR